MLNVTVERSKWLRGEGTNESYLLRTEDGKMCCVGFACLAAGLSPNQIDGVASADELECKVPKPLDLLIHKEYRIASDIGAELYELNDDSGDEEKIAELGRSLGINFTFVD